MAFDASQFGATPASSSGPGGGFDPSQFGATPVQQSSTQSPAPQSSSLADTIWNSLLSPIKGAFNSGVSQIKEGAQTISKGAGVIPAAEAGLQIESGAASALTSPLAPLFAPVKSAINAIADKVSDSPDVQKFATSPAGEETARVAGDVANAGNVASTILGADQVPDVAAKVAGKVSDTLDAATAPKPENTDPIVSAYTKAVKPSVAGKTGPGQLDAYNNSVVSAVKSIAANKDNLSFETDTGTEAARLPESRAELADAVAQTKQQIFSQYDALAKKATGQGAQIPLDKAGDALDEVMNSEALKLTNPGAVKYAQDMQSRLQNPDGTYKTVTPDIAQQAITNWNGSLKAFYRNPTYDTASHAAIDAGVVSKLRESLDETINNATGKDYQSLKNQYGALLSVEKDVNKAALTQAKQTGSNASGLGKYVDVFSGGDMLSGLLSLNPALFAKGAAQSTISHFFQWYNSPDRAVSSMFKAAVK